jgi:hypothetical protein
VAGFEAEGDGEGETVTAGGEFPFFVVSSGGCDLAVVVGVGSAVSVAEAAPTVVAVAVVVVVVVFPSTLGFDDAAPPFPPFPLAPLGGDDLRDEDEFAVKYLCLFPLPSPPPPDFEEKNEKARTWCCVACVVVDVDVAAAVEASETAGRAATSRANIYKEIREVRRKWIVQTARLPTFRLLLVSGRGMCHRVTDVTQSWLTRCDR